MSLTIQLKLSLGDSHRHISILKSTSLLDLQATVATMFALPRNAVLKFTYIDEENDRISIGSSQELADAFAQSNALHLLVAETGEFFVPTEEEKVVVAENNSDDDDDASSSESEEESALVQFFRDLGARLQGEGASVAAQVKKAVDELLQSGVVARDQLAQAYAALAASPKEMQDLVSKMIVILREQHATIAALGADAALSRARHGALCDRCRLTIVGVRYKCSACADFDLCAGCFRLNAVDHQHPESHLFLTIVAPLRGSPAVFYQPPVPLPPPMPPVPVPVPVRRSFVPPPPPAPRGPLWARLVSDETIPEGTKVKPGEQFTKIWRIENNGGVAWPSGCVVVAVGGQTLSDFEASEALPAVQPGQSISVAVDMRAPQEPGEFTSFWRLAENNNERFGARLWVTIQVEEEEAKEEVAEEEQEQPEPPVDEPEPEPPVSEAPVGDSILNVIERSFEHIEQAVAQIIDPPAAAIEPAAAPIDDSLWRSQRSQLKAMGFGQNEEQLQQLLQKHNGEVLKVVQELLEDL